MGESSDGSGRPALTDGLAGELGVSPLPRRRGMPTDNRVILMEHPDDRDQSLFNGSVMRQTSLDPNEPEPLDPSTSTKPF